MALIDEFRTYIRDILPRCIQVLSDDERCNDYTYVVDILHTLEVFRGQYQLFPFFFEFFFCPFKQKCRDCDNVRTMWIAET